MYKESITRSLSGPLGQLTARSAAIDKLTYSVERGSSFKHKINQPCHCCRVKSQEQHFLFLHHDAVNKMYDTFMMTNVRTRLCMQFYKENQVCVRCLCPLLFFGQRPAYYSPKEMAGSPFCWPAQLLYVSPGLDQPSSAATRCTASLFWNMCS